MYELFKKGVGSLAYRDAWNLFDQIIVSEPLVHKRRKGTTSIPHAFSVSLSFSTKKDNMQVILSVLLQVEPGWEATATIYPLSSFFKKKLSTPMFKKASVVLAVLASSFLVSRAQKPIFTQAPYPVEISQKQIKLQWKTTQPAKGSLSCRGRKISLFPDYHTQRRYDSTANYPG